MLVDFGKIGDLVALLTTCVGLVTAISTLLTNISQHINKPREASPLKFWRVWRQEVETSNWKRLRSVYLVQALGYLVGLLIISLSLFIFRRTSLNLMVIYVLYALPLLLGLYNIAIFTSLFLKMGNDPKDARFFLFQRVEVDVEADFDTVFAECQKALKQINARGVEFDAQKRYLEADVGLSLRSPGGLLHIQINPLQHDQSSCYSLHVCVKQRFFSFGATASSSWNINQFLRQLVGK